ncbi:MAG TPA: sensor histidine kinase [Anaeromyxobacteraceae bacterium]|nr:sensor histidine kinase [Anaeromyxobacteraceae bacterium]
MTAVVLLAGLASAAEPARSRRVLAVYQSEAARPVNVAFNAGLRAALPSAGDVDLLAEYLDAERFSQPIYEDRFRDWLRTKYGEIRPDAIVAVGDAAIRFLADPATTPWPDVPVVFGLTVEAAFDVADLPPNFTGVTEHLAIRETIDLALHLLPATRRLVLVGGASWVDTPLSDLLRREGAGFASRLQVTELFGLPMPALQERLRSLPGDTVVLVASFYRDGSGRVWFGPELLRALASAAPGPIFSMHAHLLGAGVIGGVVSDYEESGRRVGRMVSRILAGETVASVRPEPNAAHRIALDGRELDRWQIPDARVPAGADVRFREPSLWSRHRWSVAIFAAVLAVQTALIAGLLVQRRGRRHAEANARENLAVVAHLNRVGAVGELAGSLAHELNSPLGAVLNNAQAARRMIARVPGYSKEVRESLDDIVQDARRAGEVIRRMRAVLRREDLRPVPVDVAAVIRDAVRLVEADARDRDVVLAVDVEPELPPVSGDDVQLAQVVLNLVMNGMDALARTPREHRRIAIRAAARHGQVEVIVVDSGSGIAVAERERVFEPFYSSKPAGLGLGLAISRSIVEAHGGSIAVDDGPGGGAMFRVLLPATEERWPAQEASA